MFVKPSGRRATYQLLACRSANAVFLYHTIFRDPELITNLKIDISTLHCYNNIAASDEGYINIFYNKKKWKNLLNV